jgi:hypothetical protein
MGSIQIEIDRFVIARAVSSEFNALLSDGRLS